MIVVESSGQKPAIELGDMNFEEEQSLNTLLQMKFLSWNIATEVFSLQKIINFSL